jgi:hypothetical protein
MFATSSVKLSEVGNAVGGVFVSANVGVSKD